ncbi:predicted protein [Nematostella vectensis]|uniref:Uncharacterized protein n=1 Tax=Nematostella vectensis TaxID=45351 RepID=A7RYS3_NEMVE|nr:predicted protein [Nematostella vectensis]|eukprot:XP_001635476.1 predicted protein [Nematostella vectensis]
MSDLYWIIGCSAGGGLLLIIFIVIVTCMICKKKRRRKRDNEANWQAHTQEIDLEGEDGPLAKRHSDGLCKDTLTRAKVSARASIQSDEIKWPEGQRLPQHRPLTEEELQQDGNDRVFDTKSNETHKGILVNGVEHARSENDVRTVRTIDVTIKKKSKRSNTKSLSFDDEVGVMGESPKRPVARKRSSSVPPALDKQAGEHDLDHDVWKEPLTLPEPDYPADTEKPEEKPLSLYEVDEKRKESMNKTANHVDLQDTKKDNMSYSTTVLVHQVPNEAFPPPDYPDIQNTQGANSPNHNAERIENPSTSESPSAEEESLSGSSGTRKNSFADPSDSGVDSEGCDALSRHGDEADDEDDALLTKVEVNFCDLKKERPDVVHTPAMSINNNKPITVQIPFGAANLSSQYDHRLQSNEPTSGYKEVEELSNKKNLQAKSFTNQSYIPKEIEKSPNEFSVALRSVSHNTTKEDSILKGKNEVNKLRDNLKSLPTFTFKDTKAETVTFEKPFLKKAPEHKPLDEVEAPQFPKLHHVELPQTEKKVDETPRFVQPLLKKTTVNVKGPDQKDKAEPEPLHLPKLHHVETPNKDTTQTEPDPSPPINVSAGIKRFQPGQDPVSKPGHAVQDTETTITKKPSFNQKGNKPTKSPLETLMKPDTPKVNELKMENANLTESSGTHTKKSSSGTTSASIVANVIKERNTHPANRVMLSDKSPEFGRIKLKSVPKVDDFRIEEPRKQQNIQTTPKQQSHLQNTAGNRGYISGMPHIPPPYQKENNYLSMDKRTEGVKYTGPKNNMKTEPIVSPSIPKNTVSTSCPGNPPSILKNSSAVPPNGLPESKPAPIPVIPEAPVFDPKPRTPTVSRKTSMKLTAEEHLQLEEERKKMWKKEQVEQKLRARLDSNSKVIIQASGLAYKDCMPELFTKIKQRGSTSSDLESGDESQVLVK